MEDYFGRLVAERRMNELEDHINLLTTFQDIGPVFMLYKGFIVRKMTHSLSHIFYTVHNNAVYIISITDTRMSPTTIRRMIREELKKGL